MLSKVCILNINPNFGSSNNPVQPFTIKTSQGKLYVKELKAEDCSKNKTMYKVSKMMVDNFAEGSNDPEWRKFLEPQNQKLYLNQIKLMIKANKEIFMLDDGNTTFLVARNKKGAPRAGLILCGFKDIKGVEDPLTGYLDTLVVDKAYRGNNVGKTLLQRAEKNAKGVFTDIYLEAYNRAVPFYESLGYKKLDLMNLKFTKIIKKIMLERDDCPKFVTLMSKAIDDKAMRWLDRIFKRL